MADRDQTPSLGKAFPRELRPEIEAIVPIIPVTDTLRSPDDVGPVFLNGQRLHIPSRIYNPEPDASLIERLSSIEEQILACLYTRHHDGHVRERALGRILDSNQAWVAPFIVQLLGEYVLEIVEIVYTHVSHTPQESLTTFARENPLFMTLTAQRATCYWDCYHRARFRSLEDYPALRALRILRPDPGR